VRFPGDVRQRERRGDSAIHQLTVPPPPAPPRHCAGRCQVRSNWGGSSHDGLPCRL
jgi:hypothetical protein